MEKLLNENGWSTQRNSMQFIAFAVFFLIRHKTEAPFAHKMVIAIGFTFHNQLKYMKLGINHECKVFILSLI